MRMHKFKLNHEDDPYTQTRHSGGIAVADDPAPTPDPPPSDPPPPPADPPEGPGGD